MYPEMRYKTPDAVAVDCILHSIESLILWDRSKITSQCLFAKVPKTQNILQTECGLIYEPTLTHSVLSGIRTVREVSASRVCKSA